MITALKVSIFALLVLVSITISAQTYNGDLMLTTQEEVDAFNYTKVNGGLSIKNTSTGTPITNLNGLSELAEVGVPGVLNKFFNISSDSLSNLNGLSNLKRINGHIDITSDRLVDISGLASVTYIGGDLGLFCESLEDIPVFDSISHCVIIRIDDCHNLKSISGFRNMISTGWLKIYNCPNLESIQGFQSLENASGSITVKNNPKLVDISGFQNLISAGSNFTINNNSQLSDFCSLYNLVYNNGGIVISGNAQNPTSEEIIATGAFEATSVSAITKQSLSIYPNPAQNRITINCQQFIEATIYSTLGTLMFTSNNSEINLQYLQTGLYLVKVKTGQGNFQTKFIKL